MHDPALTILFAAVVSAKSLGIALWIGLGVLTLSLLVLMCTRWGKERPLSKCVALSIFAHVLLAGYAYGTRLIFDQPPSGGDDVIRLTLQPLGDEGSEQQQPKRPAKPWEQLTTENSVQPDVEPQQRLVAQAAPMPQRTAAAEWAGDAALPANSIAAPAEPDRPTAEAPGAANTRVKSTALTAAEIETPNVRRKAEDQPVAPENLPLARKQTSTPQTTPARTTNVDLPSELVEETSQIQRLADAATTESADAVAAARDQLDQSANRDASQREASGAVSSSPNNQFGPTPVATNAGAPLPEANEGRSSETRPPSTPRRLGDGQPVPELYKRRIGQARFRMLERYGGSPRTEAAVDAALAWLAAHQNADGRWDADSHGAGGETRRLGSELQRPGANADTGITGLSLLAFLGAGHTHLEGRYRKNVQHGLEHLLRAQGADGNLCGPASTFAKMYCHGMASLALSEAYAMTGDHRMEPFMRKAVQYTIDAQHPTGGGWRYQPGDRGDMSQFGWQVMALRSAEEGGVTIPDAASAGMRRFLVSVSRGAHGGLASYRAGEAASRPMTAEALACRAFLGELRDHATIDEATQSILEELPRDGKPNLYYWYYGSLALFQVQGDAWRQWSEALQRQLLALQSNDGVNAGSWEPDTQWGGYGGRAYSTAMGALCLEVYYRYLPLYETAAR